MGHLVNPVTFRLSKSKFWISVWNNYNKKNYKKFFLEDYNNFSIFKWLLNIINYEQIGFKLLDFNLIKNFKFFIFNISLIFEDDYIIDVLKNVDIIYKKFFFDKFLFKLTCLKNKKYYKIGNTKKIYNFNLNFKKKNEKKNLLYVKYFSNNLNNYLSTFLKKNKFYNFIKNEKKKFSRSFLFKKKINKNVKYVFYKKLKYINNLIFSINSLKSKTLKKSIFKKNIIPMKYILIFLKKFLEYFIQNIFKIKNIWINFFEKNSYRLSSRYMKRFIKFEIYKRGYKVNHIINLIKKDLTSDISVLGFKLGFFGRYQKKLRNKDFVKISGPLAPSNLNSLVSYENFVVLLKQGISGIELSVIKKMKKNEIF